MAPKQPLANAGDNEALRQAEQKLRDLLNAKKIQEKKLVDTEYQIHQLESAYLQNVGNLMRGYEPYITRQTTRRKAVAEAERMFSGSSASSKFSLMRKELELDGAGEKREGSSKGEQRSVKRRKIKEEPADGR
eukprot:TRINITY_DN51457_c0_g1_i1.p1 TRINITY_DN51457_c0_g1~~TRINITY_DN51457_c0_g1_i1.p1  ORF type:complete len:133 (-),score=23.50 TRINITY_DN51457_c0_g1_i1:57-455(-)